MGIEERKEDGFLHKVMNALHGGVEGFWNGREGDVTVTKETVTDLAGEIDFPRGTR